MLLGVANKLPSVSQPNQVIVLCYHSVPSRQDFREQMSELLEQTQPLSMKDFEAWRSGRLTFNSVRILLTFDDAYADQFANAVPVLRSLGIPAVFFPVTAFIGQHSNWWHEFAGTPHLPLMTRDQIASLAADGFEIGSHTHTHPRLTEITLPELRVEIHESKQILEDLLGKAVDLFCYPYGRHNSDVVAAIRQEGFRLAFTTQWGVVDVGADPLRVQRVPVLGSPSPSEFRSYLSGRILHYWNLRRFIPVS
jgi:peptidoglycan/xylan/chitin deacetylase (PgdA/CDA1 family)